MIYAWASILAISYCLLLQVEPSRVGNVSSLMTDILFAFPALFFRAPKCGQLASRSRSVSTHIHTGLCTIYRCTARPPPPSPSPSSSSCCPLAFRVLSLFDAPLLRQISALFVHYWPRYTSPLNELLSKWMYATLVYLHTNTATYSNSNSNSYAANRIDLANRWPPPRLP